MVLAWREPRVRVVASIVGAVDFWWDVTKLPPGPEQEARKASYGPRLRELVASIDPEAPLRPDPSEGAVPHQRRARRVYRPRVGAPLRRGPQAALSRRPGPPAFRAVPRGGARRHRGHVEGGPGVDRSRGREAAPCAFCRARTGCATRSFSSRKSASWAAGRTRCSSRSRRPRPSSSSTAITGTRRSPWPTPKGFRSATASAWSARTPTARAPTSSSGRWSPLPAIASSSIAAWRSASTSAANPRSPPISRCFNAPTSPTSSSRTSRSMATRPTTKCSTRARSTTAASAWTSSNRITVRGVTVRDFYCDGIVWGISHDVVVENCHLHDGARLALHSGLRVAAFDRPRQPRAA